LNVTVNLTSGGLLVLTNGQIANQVSVSAGVAGSGTSGTINTANLSNAGSLTASTGSLTIQMQVGATVLTVTGAGSLNTTAGTGLDVLFNGTTAGAISMTGGVINSNRNVNFNGGTGSVSAINVASIAGTTFANGTDIGIQSLGGTLTSSTMTATAGSIALTANGLGATVVDNSTMTATNDINIVSTGANGITVGTVGGTNVTMTAGTTNAAINRTTTTIIDPNVTANPFPTTGQVMLSATAGDLTVNDAAVLTSAGENVVLNSTGDVSLGNANNYVALGANIIVNAADIISMPTGTTFQTVAQFLAGSGTVTIDGQTVRDYSGGTIFIYAGSGADALTIPQINTMIAALPQSRLVGGSPTPVSGGGLTITGGPSFDTPGGGSIQFVVKAGGAINVTGGTFNANGGVIFVDPPGTIGLGGVIFNAFAPGIFGPIPPVPPPPPPPDCPGCVAIDPPLPLCIGCGVILADQEDPRMVSPGPPIAPTDVEDDKAQQQTTVLNMVQMANCKPTGLATPLEMKGMESWIVASGACQNFTFEGDEGSAIIGSGGTAFMPSGQRTVLLREGKIVSFSGQRPVNVKTAQGNVSIAANSATLVEQTPSGVVRVSNITGGETNVAVTRDGQTKVVSAQPGEELLIADSSLGEEEMISVDGVDREPISAAIAVAGVRVEKRKFDSKMMMEREKLLMCNLGCFSLALRKRIENMKAHAGSPIPVKASMNNAARTAKTQPVLGNDVVGSITQAADTAELQPIRFVHPTGSGTSMGLHTLLSDAATIKHGGKAAMVLEQSGVVSLHQGETLVAATKPTVIKSGKHHIAIAAGTIALISKEDNVTKVRNLWESDSHSIQVSAGNRMVTVCAGQELMVGPTGTSLTKAVKGDLLGRRHIKSFDMAGNHSAMRSEVSLVSLMQNNNVLSRLVRSENDSDKEIAGKLMKMAAALSVVTGGRGAYSPVSP